MPLRVGVLLDSFLQPAWARKLTADIQASPFARVRLVVRRERPRGAGNRDELHLFHAETPLGLNRCDGIVVIDLLRQRRRFP